MKIELKKLTKLASELLLIVVGILLALQIENWNEDRKQAQFTKETLQEINNSLAADVKHLKSRIERLKDISEAMSLASKAIHENAELTSSFSRQFNYLNFSILLELKTGSYETLKVTGLNLIKNSELRSQLVNLYDFEYPRIIWMLEKELNEPNIRFSNPIFNKYVSYSHSKNNDEYFAGQLTDYTKLINDSEVIKAIRDKNNRALGIIQRLERLIFKVEKLVKTIDAELK